MAPKRPSALEVTDGFEEDDKSNAAPPPLLHAMPVLTKLVPAREAEAMASAKRKSTDFNPGDARANKRSRLGLPAGARFSPDPKLEYVLESKLLVLGEDVGPTQSDIDVVRLLTNFTIYDPRYQNSLVDLSTVDEEFSNGNIPYEVVGQVLSDIREDDEVDLTDLVDLLDDNQSLYSYVKLKGFLRYVVKYDVAESQWGSIEARIYLQTERAFYSLITPSEEYRPFYEHFYIPRRLAQAIIPAALSTSPTASSFLKNLRARVDPILRSNMQMSQYNESDILRCSDAICNIVQSHERWSEMNHTFLNALLPALSSKDIPRLRTATRQQPRLPESRRNMDDEVLKKDKAQNTVVTPLIAALAKDFVHNPLSVLGNHGSYTNELSKAEKKHHQLETVTRIKELCQRILDGPKLKRDRIIDYDKNERIPGELHRYPAITINGERYQKGDCVLLPHNEKKLWDEHVVKGSLKIPEDSRLDDFFWFAKILYFDTSGKSPTAHIQWFQHGSRTVLGELAHPQELFLLQWCDNQPVDKILSKIEVRPASGLRGMKNIPKDAFFYKFMWDITDSSFYEVPEERYGLSAELPPPNNCPVCMIDATREQLQIPRLIKREGRTGDAKGPRNIGVAIGDEAFHHHDFVLYKSTEKNEKAGSIGKIIGIKPSVGNVTVTVKRVGRISDLPKAVMKNLPSGTFRDERHLYLTDETDTIPATALIQLIHAPLVSQIPSVPYGGKLETWLDPCYDSNHFYIKWRFPKMMPKTTAGLETLQPDEPQCAECVQEKTRKDVELASFLGMKGQQPLRALDIFAGAGGLSKGLTSGLNGCFETTHAIEISPSACHTFKHNSPNTIVYNQCANNMLRYAMKTAEGHEVERLMTLESILDPDPKKKLVPVPTPPAPTEIDVIAAGFPCQTFSGLNQFRDASDVRSNLVLNGLSWVDWMRPKYAVFENVSGFLDQTLAASPTSQHRTKGGIGNGYFKLMVRALIDMGYQVRYGLLDAAHYGTPQRRSRFILVASQTGIPLPNIPFPTHHFVSIKAGKFEKILQQIVPNYGLIAQKANDQKGCAKTVPDTTGTALFNTVTIADAIGDLPRWNWAHPRPDRDRRFRNNAKQQQYLNDIPSVRCDSTAQFWGKASKGKVKYGDNPQTRYQKVVRACPESIQDLQHVTRTFLPKVLERVIHVPIKPGANFTSLPEHLQEYQTAHPLSAVGRAGYQYGPYSRPDANGVFQTTVTNVSPTAKQCWVLNPFCHRIFSVRELARSQGFEDHFLFTAIDGRIITMHRQIGNAVPIPLGHALGRSIRKSMFDKWVHAWETATVIE